MDIIKGRLFVFGDNIDTDQIYQCRHIEITEHVEIAKHGMEGADTSFASRVMLEDILVPGQISAVDLYRGTCSNCS